MSNGNQQYFDKSERESDMTGVHLELGRMFWIFNRKILSDSLFVCLHQKTAAYLHCI